VLDEQFAGVDVVERDGAVISDDSDERADEVAADLELRPPTLMPPPVVTRRVFSGSSAPVAAAGESDGTAAVSGRGGSATGIASHACCGVTCPGSP